ncbi:protein-export chaperone SecB [candidate division WOR-3 bacterium]|nr:protein-export chaperone SecB [candidate division WOR-3 bacterium]
MAKVKSTIELIEKESLDIKVKRITLEKLSFEKKHSFNDSTSTKYHLEIGGTVLKKSDKNMTACLHKFDVEFFETKKKKAPFSLSVVLKVIYEYKEVLTDKQIKNFLRSYAIPIIWPHAREIISSLTIRAGFPPLFLPILKLPAEMTITNSK